MSLADNLTISLNEAKGWLKLGDRTDQDTTVLLLVDAAIEAAEAFLCRDFAGERVPAAVKLGCLMCVSRWYEKPVDGLQSERLGAESRTWEAPEEAKNLWRPYREMPGM